MAKRSLLGIDSVDRHSIDSAFQEAHMPKGHRCYVCSQPAKYKLIAKDPQDNTEWLYHYGYVCDYCISNSTVNPAQYGIRQLD